MTSHCDSSPAQYERNRSFGHLIHALGRAAGGPKLSSVGLSLNASKAVCSLVEGGKISMSLVSRKAQNNQTLLAGRVGLGRKADLADVPGLGEVNGRRSRVDPGIRARSRALASHGSSLLRDFRGGASRRGRPLWPPFNAQLRTGTD
ncbi:cytoplasmic antigen 1 [Lasius niger]|uniref:Cytoplasmic antigen 1 n=1 Tax=Lasius niger TaxID=67767 RepID=A0A0J7KFD3_LASNI|nr:cytoplasmic antigen 1 [Lasius niger]